MAYYDFRGKKTLVTGASRGIGKEITKQLIKYGAEVFALSKTRSHLETLRAEMPSVHIICMDVGDWNATRKAVDEIGTIDFVVNNAGVYDGSSFENITEEQFDNIFAINVKPVINISQIVVSKLKKCNKPGSIVNVSSVSSTIHLGSAVCCASKAAMDRLTKSMAVELGPYCIRVNSVSPTVVHTDMAKVVFDNPKLTQQLKSVIPLGKFCNVEDIANAVIFLLSDKAKMISGVILTVDGGQCAV